MMKKKVYGSFKDGEWDEPTHCIYSEQPLHQKSSARYQIIDSIYFYRILSKHNHKVVESDHNKWQSNTPKQEKKKANKS